MGQAIQIGASALIVAWTHKSRVHLGSEGSGVTAGWTGLGGGMREEPRRIHHHNGYDGASLLSVLRAMPRS